MTTTVAPTLELPAWADRAACTTQDTETFFPESIKAAAATPAKRVCWDCPVRKTCVSWALGTRQKYGIWGGLTERERERIHRYLQRGGDPARAARLADELAEPPPLPVPADGVDGCRVHGALVEGTDRLRNGAHPDGRQRWICGPCKRERERRRYNAQ